MQSREATDFTNETEPTQKKMETTGDGEEENSLKTPKGGRKTEK